VSAPAPWILLRGLTRDSRHWGRFHGQLSAQQPEARIVALDLPGNGALSRERSPANVEAMAEYCRTELRRRGIAPPYYLLAMSLGAMAAVAWAARHPQELSGCVLINTSMRPFSRPWQRLRPSAFLALLQLALTRPPAAAAEQIILRLTSAAPEAAAAVLGDWSAWRSEQPVTLANTARQLLAAARFTAPRIRPPTRFLVLAGMRDTLVNPRCSLALARAWDCPLAEHPSAGHDLPLDDGSWVAGQAARFRAAER
jgi:pimeloyl-ACP methyl ester carboxylesterase